MGLVYGFGDGPTFEEWVENLNKVLAHKTRQERALAEQARAKLTPEELNALINQLNPNK